MVDSPTKNLMLQDTKVKLNHSLLEKQLGQNKK